MKTKSILIATFICLFSFSALGAADLPSADPEDVGLSPERLDRIDAVLKADVESGKIPGAVLLIARKGKIAYFKHFGTVDEKKTVPMQDDSIFRVYSMTKPVIGAAIMVLMEEGKLTLADPVSKFIPAFKDVQVVGEIKIDAEGNETVASTVKPNAVMTIQDLLRHTSGLSYWFWPPKAVQAMYFKADLRNNNHTVAEMCDKLANIPLVAQPGSKYVYSMSYDVLGRVIEVASGMPLDQFMQERIFQPLGMKDSGFQVKEVDLNRFVYMDPKDLFYHDPTKPVVYFGGGGGMVSTAMDYARFAQMLLNGGELDGKRMLGPRTVEFMSADHLGVLGNRDDPLYIPGRGYGQGFGFYVRVDEGRAYFTGNVGEYYKGGAGGTVFWIDPEEELAAVYMMTASTLRNHYRFLIKSMIYQAIVD